MRVESLDRLNRFNTSISDPHYLHLKFLFQDITEAINTHAGKVVLDMGCGNKPYQPLFSNVDKYIGCDVVQSSERKVDVLCECTNVPLGNEEFDTVFSTQVLEHVEEHLKMLQEAYRLLKPGGKIILSAPMCWEHHETPYDFFRFTRYGMRFLFEKAGFEVIQIKPNGGKWAFLGQMTQNIIKSSTDAKKTIASKFFWFLHRYFLKFLINLFYGMLEKADKDDDFITLNWVVVAQKPA